MTGVLKAGIKMLTKCVEKCANEHAHYVRTKMGQLKCDRFDE